MWILSEIGIFMIGVFFGLLITGVFAYNAYNKGYNDAVSLYEKLYDDDMK